MKVTKVINEGIMKRSFLLRRAAALVFAAVLALGMANCRMEDNSIPQASNGLTTIRVTGSSESVSTSSARTIMPGKITTDDISKYIITLTNGTETIIYGDDSNENTSAITGSGVKFNLSDGTWTVTVNAYRMLVPNGSGIESEYKVATGTSTITVQADGANTLTIPLNLIENDSTFKGVFYWNLILPSDVTLTTFTLDGVDVPHTFEGNVTSGSMEKAAGVYKLSIVLTKTTTGETAGIYEAVHIYAGLVSSAAYDFTYEGAEFSFADEVLIAGSLNITRTGPPNEAVAYRVQAYYDEDCTDSIAGAYADITATTSNTVTWYINIPVATYISPKFSSKIVYLKADVSTTPNYYSYVSQHVTTAPDIGLQGVSGVNVSIEICEKPPVAAPGHPTTTESDGQLTVQWSAVDRATSYEVWKSTTNNSTSADKYSDTTGTSTTITGLTNDTIYYVWVKAKNYGGTSVFSTVASGMPNFQGLKLTINTGSSNSFILPIRKEVTGLNLTIDWGDGNIQTVTTAPTDYNGIPHTYTALNTDFVIRLTGSCKTNSTASDIGKCGFGFTYNNTSGYNASSNKVKIIKAEGHITALTTGSTATSYAYCYLFYGCTNLRDISGLIFTETTVGSYFLRRAFYGCTSLASLPDNFLSNITIAGMYFLGGDSEGGSGRGDYGGAFYGCTSLTSLPDNFLSNITYAGDYFLFSAFLDCTSLTSLPDNFLSNITTPRDNFLEAAFKNCNRLTSLPDNFLSNITTTGTHFLRGAFFDCTRLNYIDLFSDETTLTINGDFCMQYAFYNVASSATTELTLRIHGTTVLTPFTDSASLVNANVLKIYVKSDLVQAYKNAESWSIISDNKFDALHN